MTSDIHICFLGTGTSVGVPQIGCTCAVCRSEDPKNKRLRSSILVTAGGTRLLVDSGPDLRQQALRENITAVDAVLYTHNHLDHVAGFDDLRAFCWKREDKLPLYASPETMNTLHAMYPWAFSEGNTYRGYVRPDGRILDGPVDIGRFRVTPVPVVHGTAETFGYLFEAQGRRIGYACDIKSLPDASAGLWGHLDVLILDSLRYLDHPTHMNVGEALAVMERLKPERGYLTHMSHDIDYKTLAVQLPATVSPAYDGLCVTLPPREAEASC